MNSANDTVRRRFFYIVTDTVGRYRGDTAVAWDFTAELHVEPDWQYALAYCGHNHRDPDAAKRCGELMLRKCDRGIYPGRYCAQSPTTRHLMRSNDTCVYCGLPIEETKVSWRALKSSDFKSTGSTTGSTDGDPADDSL